MNLRRIAQFALLLALGAVVIWFWLGKEAIPPMASGVVDSSRRAVDSRDGPSSKAVDSQLPFTASQPTGAQPRAPVQPTQMTSAVLPGAPLVRTNPAATPLPVASSMPVPRPELQPEAKEDLEGIQFMFRDFRTRMGENPVGSNAEIMKAVMGGNPVNARLGPPTGQSLNDQGALVDRWGTPYFFHQLSKTSMETRSAGPDRRLWTTDDIVRK